MTMPLREGGKGLAIKEKRFRRPLNSRGRGFKALMARPLKRNFFAASPCWFPESGSPVEHEISAVKVSDDLKIFLRKSILKNVLFLVVVCVEVPYLILVQQDDLVLPVFVLHGDISADTGDNRYNRQQRHNRQAKSLVLFCKRYIFLYPGFRLLTLSVWQRFYFTPYFEFLDTVGLFR